MRRRRPTLLLLALVLPAAVPAVAADKAPAVDANRIINDSYNLLHNREPEMTGTEYALYEKVVALIPTRPEYAMSLLQSLMGEGKPTSPAFDFVLGNAYHRGGDIAKATVYYQKAIEKYPDFLRAWTNLGIVQFSQQHYVDAVNSLTRAVSLGDRSGATYGLLGYCHVRMDNPVAAEMAYMQACVVEPNNADWIRGLAELYFASRQYARAAPLVRELLRMRPRERPNWMLQADLQLAENRTVAAIATLETAGRIGVLDRDGVLLLGDLYAQQGLHPEAVATYAGAMRDHPEAGADRLLRYARSLLAGGDAAAARKVLALVPEGGEVSVAASRLDTLASLQIHDQDWPAARATLESLLRLRPMDGRALMALGNVLQSSGEKARAVLIYEQAAGVTEFTYSAQLELANLALEAKDYVRAATHLRRAIALQRSPALEDYLAKVSALLPPEPGT